jgi:hypothetical protein
MPVLLDSCLIIAACVYCHVCTAMCVLPCVYCHAEANGLQDVQLRGILLTHLHMGHYLGLMQFGREGMDWQGLMASRHS